MALAAPTWVQPSGPRSPYDPVKVRWPQTTSAPDRYDLQLTTDATFATIDLWHYTQQTAGLSGWTAWVPWLGPTPAVGTTYYCRARGRLGAAEIGPWSRVVKFLPDPSAVSAPYADWARDVLGAWSEPAPVVVLGTLLPVATEVLALLGTEYAGRWRVRDDRHPPATDQLVAVYGLTFHVDLSSGWEVAGMTSDVPPGEA